MPFGRKKDTAGAGAGADDQNRAALFGQRGANSGGSNDNPYAQAPAADPYAQSNPYQRAKTNAYGGGPPSAGLPSGPRAGGGLPAGPRSGGLPGGPALRRGGNPYGDDRSGSGANPYGAAPKSGNPYGGMQDQSDRYGGGGAGGDRYGGGGGGGDRYGGGGSGGSSTDRYGGSGGGGGNRYGAGGAGGGGDRYGAASGAAAEDDRSGGYGANRYGGQSGYGGDRYGSGSGGSSAIGSGGRSGGGIGSGGRAGGNRYGQDDDASRDALFGDAKDRYAQRQQTGGYGSSYGNTGDSGYGGSQGGEGGGYGDRQLTAEEQEDEDVRNTKDQIRNMKREDVASTRNALRMAQMAEESGRDTLARLGTQGEHLHNAEMNLDLAHSHNKVASERARELKTLNRSMFAVHVSNPFTSASRAKAREQQLMDRHLEEKGEREATRREQYLSDQRMHKAFGELDEMPETTQRERNLAERAKYQFEADSEDEEMENEIDDNLDALSAAAGRLHHLALATGSEVDKQNDMLDRLGQKSDRVDVGLAANHASLNRVMK